MKVICKLFPRSEGRGSIEATNTLLHAILCVSFHVRKDVAPLKHCAAPPQDLFHRRVSTFGRTWLH